MRPNRADIVIIRSSMLLFVKRLIMKQPAVTTTTTPVDDGCGDKEKDDQLQSLLNYIATVHEVR
jgi:hypothetical protein